MYLYECCLHEHIRLEKKKQCNIFLFKFYFNRNIPIDIQTFLNKVAQDGPRRQHKKKYITNQSVKYEHDKMMQDIFPQRHLMYFVLM